MKKYSVTLYYQLLVFNGWSCNHPYKEIVKKQYVVDSEKETTDFERILLYNKKDTYLKLQINEENDSKISTISEDEMIGIIKSAHITISTALPFESNVDLNVHRRSDWNARIESELLYKESLKTNEISSTHSYKEVDVVILKGLIYGVLSQGKCIVPFGKYHWIDSFQCGFTRVILNQKWGIINLNGSEVMSLEYDNIKPLKQNNGTKYFECYKDGVKSIFNVSSNESCI